MSICYQLYTANQPWLTIQSILRLEFYKNSVKRNSFSLIDMNWPIRHVVGNGMSFLVLQHHIWKQQRRLLYFRLSNCLILDAWKRESNPWIQCSCSTNVCICQQMRGSKRAPLLCWLSKGQQVWHQRWIWRIHCIQERQRSVGPQKGQLADLGVARDAPKPGTISFIFMQSLPKILPNNRFLPRSQGLAPPYVENLGSATGCSPIFV